MDTATNHHQMMSYTHRSKPEVEMEPAGKWRNRWKSKTLPVGKQNRISSSPHYSRSCNGFWMQSAAPILLITLLVSLCQLNQPVQALKLPAFFSSWMQHQQQDGPLIEQSSGSAQALDDAMMTSSSNYEASRMPAPQMTPLNQQVSPKKSALHSFLMLPSKHNQLHLFSGLPRGLFGRFLTPVASPSGPAQSQAYLNPLLSWNPQSPVVQQSNSQQPQQMYHSSMLNSFGTGNMIGASGANQQQIQQMQRAPMAYSDNRSPQKHALGFGEPNEFSMLDRPHSVSNAQPPLMQQQSQLQMQTYFRPQAQQQPEELPQQLVIFSGEQTDVSPIIESLNNSLSQSVDDNRSNVTSIDDFITTLRPLSKQQKQQQANATSASEDSFQKVGNPSEVGSDPLEVANNKQNNVDNHKDPVRPLGSGSVPNGNSRTPEQNADGLESSAAAIIVAPTEQVDVAPGELTSDEQVESFILGPYKGQMGGSHEFLGESQPLAGFEQHSLSQQQVPQQQHLLTGKTQQVSSYNRPLLSTTSLASSLIQQAKNLIHLPFAHISSGKSANTMAESLRTTGSSANSLFRGQDTRGQVMQLESSMPSARKEKSANFLNIGQPQGGILSMQPNSDIGEPLAQPSNYRPFHNGYSSPHNNKGAPQQQHYQHQSVATTGNRLTVVGAPTTKAYYNQQQRMPASSEAGYFLMAHSQMADAKPNQHHNHQQFALPARLQATQFEFGHARQPQSQPQQQQRQQHQQSYVPYFVDYTQGPLANRKQPQRQLVAGQTHSPADNTFPSSSSSLNSFQALRQQQLAQQSFQSLGMKAVDAAKLASQHAANIKSGLYQIEPPRSVAASRIHKQLTQQQHPFSPFSQQNMFEANQQQQMADVELDPTEQELEQAQEPQQQQQQTAADASVKGSSGDNEQVLPDSTTGSASTKQVAASTGIATQLNNSSIQRKPGSVFNVPMTSASELKTLRLSQDITLYDLEGTSEVRQEPGKPHVGFLDTEVHTLPYMLSMQPTTGRVQHASPPTRSLHFSSQHPQQQHQMRLQQHDTLPLGRFPLNYLAPPPPQPAQSPFEALYQELGAPQQHQQQSLYQKPLPVEFASQLIRVEQPQAINYGTDRAAEHQFVLAIDHQNGSPQGMNSLLSSSMIAPGTVSQLGATGEQSPFTSSATMPTTNAAPLIEASTSAAAQSPSRQSAPPKATTTTTLDDNTNNNAGENLDTATRSSPQPNLPAAPEPSSPSTFCADRNPGLYADESQRCKAYYQCAPTGHQMFRCNNHTQFNQKTQNCDWWYNVNCGAQQQMQASDQQVYQSMDETIGNSANDKPTQVGDEQVSNQQDRVATGSVQDISNFKQDNRWTVASEESINSLQASSESPTTVVAPDTTSFSHQNSASTIQQELPVSQTSAQEGNTSELASRLDSTSTTEIAPSASTQAKEAESTRLQVGTLTTANAGDSTRLTSASSLSSSASLSAPKEETDSRVQISLIAEGGSSSSASAATTEQLTVQPTASPSLDASANSDAQPSSQKPKRLVQSEFGFGAKQVETEAARSARASTMQSRLQDQLNEDLYSTSANHQLSDQRSASAVPETLPRRRYERRYGERLSKT